MPIAPTDPVRPLRIALAVPGTFHALSLAEALCRQGHEVHVWTTHPVAGDRPFALTADAVRGLSLRALSRLGLAARPPIEALIHRGFGAWAAARIRRGRWDVVHAWSGVAEEIFTGHLPGQPLRLLMRGSSHIRVQRRLLEEEGRRCGLGIDRPSDWMTAREVREYGIADRIRVLSLFARQSFLSEAVPESRVRLLPSGLPPVRHDPSAAQARSERILSGGPLTVLFCGSLLYRKGLYDLERIAAALAGPRMRFVAVGPPTPESGPFLRRTRATIVHTGALHGQALEAAYREADVFFFPTIEDGFPQTVAHAVALGVPTLTTSHGNGPDLIEEGLNGWVLPARATADFIETLSRCAEDRPTLARMALYRSLRLTNYDWGVCARRFADDCLGA